MAHPFRQSAEEYAQDVAGFRTLSAAEEAALRARHEQLVAEAGRLAAAAHIVRVEHPSTHPGVGGGPDRYYDRFCAQPVRAVDESGPVSFPGRGMLYAAYVQLTRLTLRGRDATESFTIREFGVVSDAPLAVAPDHTIYQPQIAEWSLPARLPAGQLRAFDLDQVNAFGVCLAGLQYASLHASDAAEA